jgi:hypothetical protein
VHENPIIARILQLDALSSPLVPDTFSLVT